MSDDSTHQTGDEFEREPVPEKALLGLKSYVGQFAGEHVAGTELMIGPLFLASGVSAFDFIVGLLVGNFLAVLSWRFFTAPIATRCRLTLYYQLEKICGRKLVVAYNLANGVMFTVLAGAMMTVSATALGVYFKFSIARLTLHIRLVLSRQNENKTADSNPIASVFIPSLFQFRATI